MRSSESLLIEALLLPFTGRRFYMESYTSPILQSYYSKKHEYNFRVFKKNNIAKLAYEAIKVKLEMRTAKAEIIELVDKLKITINRLFNKVIKQYEILDEYIINEKFEE